MASLPLELGLDERTTSMCRGVYGLNKLSGKSAQLLVVTSLQNLSEKSDGL